jgi:hypothetical protein
MMAFIGLLFTLRAMPHTPTITLRFACALCIDMLRLYGILRPPPLLATDDIGVGGVLKQLNHR